MPNPLHAWRELLTRIFDGFVVQENVTPPWLVNPRTARQLKLDLLYPQAATAVRFVGFTGQRKRRLSDEEEDLAQGREDVRTQLCRAQGITLVIIDPQNDIPRDPLKEIASALGRASRHLAQSQRPDREKAEQMPRLAMARQQCEHLLARVRQPDDLVIYAELWLDRQAAIVAATEEPLPVPSQPVHRYREGQMVRHTAFGPGTVLKVEAREGDEYVTVAFVTAGERTFASRLVGDKLIPQP